jgi:hypothetical protein
MYFIRLIGYRSAYISAIFATIIAAVNAAILSTHLTAINAAY